MTVHSRLFIALAACLCATGAQAQQPPAFEYAVKFVCGAANRNAPVVALGTYFTAINVHNPSKDSVKFVKKIAVALPGQKAGPVSKFVDAALKPDEAFEIDCPDIYKISEQRGFLKGFVVIQSPSELDIVGVYTAAPNAAATVATMAIERVPPRKK
jgi:hypothetical protein